MDILVKVAEHFARGFEVVSQCEFGRAHERLSRFRARVWTGHSTGKDPNYYRKSCRPCRQDRHMHFIHLADIHVYFDITLYFHISCAGAPQPFTFVLGSEHLFFLSLL